MIDLDDLPKMYGGNLDWKFGMPPQLDEPAAKAVEKNGTNGWIPGPCLWEQNQRVPVGTVGGKSRRPAKVEPVSVSTSAEEEAAQLLPSSKPPQPPKPTLTNPEPEGPVQIPTPAESSNPPSVAHSGSTASTSIGIPASESNAAPTTTDTTSTSKVFHASETPIAANGQIFHAGDVKPPMHRFVTAVEDLGTTTRPTVTSTTAIAAAQ